MTPSGRRAAAALALLAGLLFAGRWTATLLADRWWLAAAAPEALPFFTRRALIGALLDLAATLLATAWWIANGRALVRAARALPGDTGGNPVVRRALRLPEAMGWVVVLGVALGLLFGLGASGWTDAALLALTDLRLGVPDPALGRDLGVYLSTLPFWLRVHAFATVLVLGALGTVGLGHLLAGTLTVSRGRVAISDAARRQLGVLMALLAVVIAGYQVLSPLQLAGGLPEPVDPAVVGLHEAAAFALIGVSLAVLALTLVWMARPRHVLTAGGWAALALALLLADWLLPSGQDWSASQERVADRRPFEAIAYGYRVAAEGTDPAAPDAVSALWTAALAGRALTGDTTPRLRAVPLGGEAATRPGWVAGRPDGADAVALLALADDTTALAGAPLYLTPEGSGPQPAGLARHPVPASYPGAPPLVTGAGAAGVERPNLPGRLVLAWAWQRTTLAAASWPRAGWLLDPLDRLRQVAPFALWGGLRAERNEGSLVWVADGFATAEVFPMTRRQQVLGRRVAYARAGFVGMVDPASGRVRIVLRGDADSLSVAWARIARPLVAPAPTGDFALDAPADLLGPHAAIWAADEAARLGRPAGELAVVRPATGQAGLVPAATVVDLPAERVVASLLGGRDGLVVRRSDSLELEAPDLLARRWQRFPQVQVLRDSIQARGGTLETTPVRVAATGRPSVLRAYQPMFAIGARGGVALMAVGTAEGNRVGAGRTLGEATASLTGEGSVATGPGPGESALLFEARRWLREADSAFRRGDLEAFARAFGALRGLLEGRPEPGGVVPK